MPQEIALSPDEQAQYNATAPATQPQEVQLTPEEQGQYAAATAPQQINPFTDLTPQELADLNDKDPSQFSIISNFQSLSPKDRTPDVTQRAAEAFDLVKQKSFSLPPASKMLSNLWNVAKGAGQWAYNYGKLLGVPAMAKQAITGDTTAPVMTQEELQKIQRGIAEGWAGTESAVTGLATQLGNALNYRRTTPVALSDVAKHGLLPLAASIETPEATAAAAPQRKMDNFMDAVAQSEQQSKIATGHGEFMQKVGPEVVKDLEKAGLPLRPEETEKLAQADPFSWWAFGKAFEVAPVATKALIPQAVQDAIAKLSDKSADLLKQGVGGAISTAGEAGEMGAKGIEKAAPIIAPIGTAVAGYKHYGIPGAIGGLVLGHGGGGSLERFGALLERGAKATSKAGEEIAGNAAPTTGFSQAAKDIIEAAPGAAGAVAKGAAFDVALQSQMTQTPEQREGFTPFGTVLGLAHGAGGAGKWVLGGQLAGERNWGTTSGAPNSQAFPELNTLHNSAMQAAPPAVQERIRAIQQLKQGVAPGTDVFYVPNGDDVAAAVAKVPGAEHLAFQSGNSSGVFLKDVKGADGKTRNAIIFQNVDAAPHEAVHAMDAALGETRVSELNQAAKAEYGDVWDQFTQQYAERLNDGKPLPEGTTPGDFLLDKSGFGRESGGENWQTDLSAEQKQAILDRYIGGEIRAENGDAYFRANQTGPFKSKLASTAAELVHLLGGNPLEGRVSKHLGVPLRWETFQNAGRAFKTSAENVPAAARPVRGDASMANVPTTPEAVTQNADDARTIAQQVENVPGAQGEQSPREALGTVAEAIASQAPVRYQYRGAAGETPTGGAAETDVAQRQKEIEAARNVPEDVRNLFERLGFPYKVEMSGKGPQVLDWAPVNLAANAFRWAKSISELAKRNPNAPELTRVPYPLDVAKGEFTAEGWRELFQDAQKFTRNHMAGFGGAGQEIVVPKELGAANVHTPPRSEATAPEALGQDRSDFLNMLYGERPPETPRVSRKSGVPANVIAQKVSEATEPGRVIEPSQIHAKKKQAAELGVEPGTLVERKGFKEPILGVEKIQEVNPTRGALEKALQSEGIEIPKMTKVIRRLNLEHIHSVQPEPNLPRTAGANPLTVTAGFLPVSEFLERLDKTTPEEWTKLSHGYQNGKLGNGQTGLSWDTGANAKSLEEVAALRSAQDKYSELMRAALKNKDFSAASMLGSKAQAAREAYEAATDTGGTSEFIKRYHPEAGYKAPFPETQPTAQSLPAGNEDVAKVADEYARSVGLSQPALSEKGFGIEHLTPEALSGMRENLTRKPLVDENGEISHTTGQYMTNKNRTKQNEWELKPSTGGNFTKAWILPSGKLAQFGGTWHHDWLNDQPELRKRYRIPEVTNAEDADKSRIPALKAGFARVNYDKSNDKLTVEARESDWPGIIPSVKELVANNLSKMDMMTVHLFSPSVKALNSTDTVRMFDIPKEERVSNIPFTGGESEAPAQVGMAGEAGSQQLFDKAVRTRKPASKMEAFGTGQFKPAGAPALQDFTSEDTIEKSLKRPGWAILTATEEKKGPGTSPVNVQANEDLESKLAALGYDFVPVTGKYKGVDRGKNFLVTGISPQDALALGQKFNQESVLVPQGLLYQDGSVHPVKPEETVIGKAANKKDFISQIEGGPAFSMGIDFDNKITPENSPSPVARPEQQLIGGEFSPTKELLSTKDISEMTPAELKEHYPEAAVVPDKENGDPRGVPSEIVNSPLYKEAGSETEAVKVFADRLAEFARQYKDNPAYKDGLRWYSEFVPMLKKAYGKHAQIMAELLAATSPQNNPTQNFAMANDALEMWKRGAFDAQLKKFEEGIQQLEKGTWKNSGAPTEAKFMADWIDKHDLKPRQSNGKLYNMHSVPVLQVLARRWLENTGGPKTQNFVKNLLGTGHGATYDVWADRTLRRIGYAGQQARWRILPKNAVGVSDADFQFGQKVFSTAAKQLGVRADSLQGGAWFAEKQLWADNGWGRLDLGDFRKEILNRELLNRGIEQRLSAQQAKASAPKQEQTGFDLGIIQSR